MKTTIAAALACVTLVPCLFAQDTGPRTHARLGLGTTTMHFFRGLMQQDGGIIVQPYLEISRGGVEVFNTPLAWHVGTWNSLHEGQTGTGGGNAAWYESRFYAGFTVNVSDNIALRTRYTTYHSPNASFRVGAARPTQEISFRADWADIELNNDRFKGLFLSAELAFELTGGRDAGPDEGVYLELGAAPVVAVTDDLLVTVPVRLGLSLKDYYEDGTGGDDLFGFFAIGARTSLDLCDENSLFGPWKLGTSLDIYILGDTAKRVNNGDGAEVVLGVNLNLAF